MGLVFFALTANFCTIYFPNHYIVYWVHNRIYFNPLKIRIDPTSQSYPALLQQQSNGRWHVRNLGVNGATVMDAGDLPIVEQKAYEVAMQLHPDVVVLMLGTNDAKTINWKNIESFKTDYKRLIISLQYIDTQPRVIVCSIPPMFRNCDNGLCEEHVETINAIIKDRSSTLA